MPELSLRPQAVVEADPQRTRAVLQLASRWLRPQAERCRTAALHPVQLVEIPDYCRRLIDPPEVMVVKTCPVDTSEYFNLGAATSGMAPSPHGRRSSWNVVTEFGLVNLKGKSIRTGPGDDLARSSRLSRRLFRNYREFCTAEMLKPSKFGLRAACDLYTWKRHEGARKWAQRQVLGHPRRVRRNPHVTVSRCRRIRRCARTA